MRWILERRVRSSQKSQDAESNLLNLSRHGWKGKLLHCESKNHESRDFLWVPTSFAVGCWNSSSHRTDGWLDYYHNLERTSLACRGWVTTMVNPLVAMNLVRNVEDEKSILHFEYSPTKKGRNIWRACPEWAYLTPTITALGYFEYWRPCLRPSIPPLWHKNVFNFVNRFFL